MYFYFFLSKSFFFFSFLRFPVFSFSLIFFIDNLLTSKLTLYLINIMAFLHNLMLSISQMVFVKIIVIIALTDGFLPDMSASPVGNGKQRQN